MLIWIALLVSPLLWLPIARAEWHKRRAGGTLLTLARPQIRGVLLLSLLVLIVAGAVIIRLGHLLAGAAELNLGLYFLALNMRRSQIREKGVLIAPTRGLVPWQEIQSCVWLDDSVSLFLQPKTSPWSKKLHQPVVSLRCIEAQQAELGELLESHLSAAAGEMADSPSGPDWY